MVSPPDLSGRVAIVTGGTRRLGAWLTRGLLEAGCSVLATYHRDSSAAREFEREWEKRRRELVEAERAGEPGELVVMKADAASTAQWRRVVERVAKRWGRLDILVNNVGHGLERKLSETEPEEMERLLRSNLMSAFLGIRACLDLMVETGGGAVVNLGCAGARHLTAKRRLPAYYVAKSALVALTFSFARELAPLGIRVNLLSPGFTELTEVPVEVKDRVGRAIPIGRLVEREAIVTALYQLVDLSPAARQITGTDLQVGGGWGV